MTAFPNSVDVAIVGAGTAGAAAAAACAGLGLGVLCVDRRALEDSGARWVNGVTAGAFEQAGLTVPEGEELLGRGEPFHMVAGWGPQRVVVEGHDLLDVDMRRLVMRLQRQASQRGATLIGDCQVQGVDGDLLRTNRGNVRARWLVDASGLSGTLREQKPVHRTHLCAAAQEVRECSDPAGARAYFERHGVPLGQTLCFTGIAGGYSILNVHCDGDTVSILTGSIPGDGHVSGSRILERFVQAEPWVGRRLFGGSRAIPLRRPRDRLSHKNVALLGDAACQVFPAHGSGIGPGLIAARVLAEELAAGRGVRGYNVRWQREHGGLLASYDLMRRFSQSLSLSEIEQLMGGGLFHPALLRAGLDQEVARPTVSMLPALARGIAGAPRLGRRLGVLIAKMTAVRALYARYPEKPEKLSAWSGRVDRLFS